MKVVSEVEQIEREKTANEVTTPEYLTNKEAAKVARCSPVSLWRARKSGLPFHRINSKVLIRRDELEAYLARNQRG